jgi:tetratricopeptide (TPR) repeat protein
MQTLNFFANSFGDRYLYEVNRGVFDRLGAESVFRQRFGERLLRKDTLTIIIGTDSGALVRYVQQRGIPEGSRYLFLELDGLLPVIMQELGEDPIDERIHIAGAGGLAEKLREIRFSDYAAIGAVELVESIGAIDAYLPEYRQAVAEIRQQLDAILWAYNCQLSNPTFLRCQLQNLVEEQVPAAVLRGRFAGRTALLLGGGPSLDAILPWAQAHRDRLLIFAVSRVCRRLLDAGLTPHVVVSIDPTELSFDISKELLLLDPRVLFAHANHVTYQLLGQWHGRSVYLDRRFPWDNKLDIPNVTAAGPTVTNTAFALAQAMGFSRILFGGIDLCHSSEGFSHARGSNERDAGPRLGGTGMRARTNAGNQAETTPDFFNAIQAFGAQASAARQAGIEIVNPAPDAAAIAGVAFEPLESLRLEEAVQDPFEQLHACLPADTAELRRANLRSMQRELARANGRLRKVVALADQALECNAGLFGRNGKSADFKHKRRMDKIERQLDTRLNDLSTIVRMFSSRAFLHMPPSDREWTDDEVEQAGKTYYGAYRENAREVLRLVEQAQSRVEAALIEEDQSPDFARLLQQWHDDGVPGRGRVWLQRHPDAAEGLPADIRGRFEAQRAEFEALLARRDTTHARKVRAQVSLTPVRAKLQVLFKERNESELNRLLGQLETLGPDRPEASQLIELARGYLAELAQQPEQAFAHYAALLDLVRDELGSGVEEAPSPRLEDALQRMSMIAITLNWHEQALLILETLAGLAPAYAPQYAEMLRLTGHVQAAVGVYTDYLSKAPGDHVVMLRLGRLYQSMGVHEAARTAFDYVVKNDPENKAARALLEQIETAA